MYNFFQLNRPLKRDANADLNDVFKVKTVLSDLGHYNVPDWGVTQYPDDGLFKGIKSFQQDHGLKVDGIMNPGGETEQTLSSVLQTVNTNPILNLQTHNKKRKNDGIQMAAVGAAPAIPWLAAQIPGWIAGAAGLLGMSLPLKGDTPQDDNCDYQLYNVDTPTCNEISKRRGKQAGQRCHTTASERHAACLSGKPRDQWPPLDTWNN